MVQLGKGDGRFKAGGSFGVGVEQLRNGGCLSLAVKLPNEQGQQARAKLPGQASGLGGWMGHPPPSPNSFWSEPPLIGSRARRAYSSSPVSPLNPAIDFSQ